MSRGDRIEIGKQAAQLLETPLFKEALEGIEKSIIEKLASIDVTDVEHTLELVRALQAGRRQRNLLQSHMTHGQLAEDALARKKLLPKPVKDPRWSNWR